MDEQRKAFEAHLKTMPEWAPEFEQHRAWVEQFAFWAWRAATAAERERCAKVCEQWDATHPHRLAEEIRKG